MKKNKVRTRKVVLKRFKVTKNGKVMHRGHGGGHLKSNKSKKQLRSIKVPKELTGANKKVIKRLLGLA